MGINTRKVRRMKAGLRGSKEENSMGKTKFLKFCPIKTITDKKQTKRNRLLQ